MANEWLNLDQFEVRAVHNRETGHWLAISEDIPGLYVHGRSLDEVKAKTPGAIQEMFQAMGRLDVRISVSEDGGLNVGNFHEAKSRYRVAA